MEKYDLAVIGGGFAGVAAALAASRLGINVIIVEKSNCLGGAASNALVNPFMPYSTVIDGETVELASGILKEIVDALNARGAMSGRMFLEEDLKLLLNQMAEESKITLLFHAYIFKAEPLNGKVTSVMVATKSGEMKIEADYFIDATGDAQLAYLAGCPTTLGREPDHLCQPMTLCFRLGNVDVDKFYASGERLNKAYRESRERGELMNPRENVLAFKNPVKNVLHLNTTRVVKKNPVSPIEVTEAEILARKQVFEIYDFMKKHADGLENSFLMMTASEIGVRESRMIIGEYILTGEDCRSCKKFDDAIAACNYDLDIHNPEGTGTSHYYFKPGEYYTIPYRCLVPKKVSNMLVAGRCISSDHEAQASYRIMPIVCCIGEAAGTAIGLTVKNKSELSKLDVSELQDTLKKNGAFLGI